MVNIDFEYKDRFSNGKWNKQSCTASSVDECIKIYGLNEGDVEYHITKVEKVK